MADIEIYDNQTSQDSAYARVLILGPPKAGKSSCLALSAPQPLLMINCDGTTALRGAAHLGGKFMAVDVVDRRSWKAAVALAEKLVAEKKIKSIGVDTLSLLSDALKDDISQTLKGFDIWNEMGAQMLGGCKRLMALDAHVFFTAHMTAGSDKEEGILPHVQGSTKSRLPALIDDWILMQVLPEQKPERVFYLGPQKSWTASGRNIRKTSIIEADIGLLLEELGIKP